jgi:hypothetical protein
MVISLRTTMARGRAHAVIKKILDKNGKGGGHGMIAGGLQPCTDLAGYRQMAERMNQRLLKHLSRKAPERFRPLLEEADQFGQTAVTP